MLREQSAITRFRNQPTMAVLTDLEALLNYKGLFPFPLPPPHTWQPLDVVGERQRDDDEYLLYIIGFVLDGLRPRQLFRKTERLERKTVAWHTGRQVTFLFCVADIHLPCSPFEALVLSRSLRCCCNLAHELLLQRHRRVI